jgi:hypothetical protein
VTDQDLTPVLQLLSQMLFGTTPSWGTPATRFAHFRDPIDVSLLRLSEKGKPSERAGRKANVLTPCLSKDMAAGLLDTHAPPTAPRRRRLPDERCCR